jgi:hypothetical protein
MGKDMASVDAPMGFQVYGNCLRERLYAVATAPTIGFYVGDVVMHGGDALATKWGTLPIVEDGAVVDGVANAEKLLGAVTACFDENMDPCLYIAPLEAGDGTLAGYVLVADHPEQLFIAQEDGATNAIDLDEVGTNVDIVSTTNSVGSNYTGISAQELNSDTAANTAALDVKLHFPHPDDTVGNNTDCHARWIVSINAHFYSGENAGL